MNLPNPRLFSLPSGKGVALLPGIRATQSKTKTIKEISWTQPSWQINIHLCCCKTPATPEGWKPISGCLSVSHHLLHITLQTRDDFITEIPLLFPKNNNHCCERIYITYHPSLGFPRGQENSTNQMIEFCSNSWRMQPCCIQNCSNTKPTGFGRYLFYNSLFIQMGRLWNLCLLFLHPITVHLLLMMKSLLVWFGSRTLKSAWFFKSHLVTDDCKC